MTPRVKHAFLLGLLVVSAMGGGAIAIGVLAGWSDGALGVAMLTASSVGSVISLLSFYEHPPRSPSSRSR